VGYGWVGIPEQFPGLGGLIPNWFHEFVGGTLAELPKAVEFSWVPLITSLCVSLGGLFFGWMVYRKVQSPNQDFLQIPVLKNKWYFDEIYNFVFVKPSSWIAEKFTSLYMDQTVIDGLLHSAARFSLYLGHAFRNYFDKPIINEFLGDGTGNVVKASGSGLRKIQTGRIQYYMVASVAVLVIFALLYYFLLA
jgi:NADH-quinone oxidoreductase subunit L